MPAYPPAGGAAVAVKRSWFRAAPEAVTPGPLHALTWTKISGENLFDLTDPTTPLALLAGFYSITVNICASAGQVGFASQPVLIQMDVDEMGDDATASQSILLTTGSIAPQGSMAMSYFVPADGVVHAYVNHNEEGETWNFFLEAAVMWQSATAAH